MNASTTGRDTPGLLISAAARLFAERGVDAVPLNEINRAAGQRNASALQYHFGDRAGLPKAVIAKHGRDVDARRDVLLWSAARRLRAQWPKVVRLQRHAQELQGDDCDGKTDPAAPPHCQQSMMVVPIEAPGVTVLRSLPVLGYLDREGHAEIDFNDVRVPARDVLKGEGEGFAISQTRLGPRRIHHCIGAMGMAEPRLDLMCKRAQPRVAFGKPVADSANIQDWIAGARIDIEMIRLLTFKAAHMMDVVGNKETQTEIAAIKVAAPNILLKIVDRAIHVHGGAGVTDDFPLATAYAHLRTLRLADGPDEVHKRAFARRELRQYRDLRPEGM